MAHHFIKFSKIQADDRKERRKNQIIHIKAHQTCTTIDYVTVTMYMQHNIILTSLKTEQTKPTYCLSPANIYGSGIHDASNTICSVYTWTGFEVNKGMENIAS